MNIQHIKQISITDYLQQQGYMPVQIKGINHWYCSPFRQERTPSFKVNTDRNQWYDFGTGEYGDIIDFICALHHCDMAEALQLLGNGTPLRTSPFSFGGKKDFAEHKLKLLSVVSLTSPHLLSYISERGINSVIANEFCYEINYRNADDCFMLSALLMMLADGKFVVLISKDVSHRRLLQRLEEEPTAYKSLRASWIFSHGKRSIHLPPAMSSFLTLWHFCHASENRLLAIEK